MHTPPPAGGDIEGYLGALERTRPSVMTAEQKQWAAALHECRVARSTPNACDGLRQSIHGGCRDCLLKAGIIRE